MLNDGSNEEVERTLYGFWLSPFMSLVAHLLLESGIDFEYERVSPYLGATHTDEHKKRNPLAKIPSLKDSNGVYISESQAICRYIARTYPNARPFYPCDEPVKCAAVDEKNDFISFSISGPFFNWFVVGAYFPRAFNIKTEEESHIYSLWSVFLIRGAISRLVASSSMEPFLLGAAPTLADFHLFSILELGRNFARIFEMPAFDLMAGDEKLQDFYNAMSSRASTQKILESQANELELTKHELSEKFGKAYEETLRGAKVALGRMFGHEV